MASLFSVIFLGFILVYVNLLTFEMLEDLYPSHAGRELEISLVGDQRNWQLHRVSNLARQTIHDQLLVFASPILLAAYFYYRKHTNAPNRLAMQLHIRGSIGVPRSLFSILVEAPNDQLRPLA